MATAVEASRVLLTDGRIAVIRHVTPADRAEVAALHRGLSERGCALRFLSLAATAGDEFVERVTAPADAHRGALAAVLAGHIVGVAAYEALDDPSEGEVALAVDACEQAHGVGTLLLEHLASLARRRGVRVFVAEVPVDNPTMMRVLAEAGLPTTTRSDRGVIHVDVCLEPGEEYLEAVAERERHADRASLSAVLAPRSVAVVGAGRRPGSVGRSIVRNLLGHGYRGEIYPVNPHAETIEGIPAFHSVTELPADVDLAVVCVPAPLVPVVVDECGQRGIRAVVVVTAGVTGCDGYGTRLRQVVGRHAMRLVGPNCLGVLNNDPGVCMDATFARTAPPDGPVGVVTQSGGVGIALLEQLTPLGLGVSSLVSTGDKYDVSGNDLLMWWERDGRTSVVVMYVESFGNPRKFARLARRVARVKPVVAIRVGSSLSAQRAAASHTAAAATPAATRDALFRQAGVVAVGSLGELTGAVALLASQPPPAGRSVAVVANAGGLGVLAADACEARGLRLAELSAATRKTLAALLPEHASTANPVDTTAGVDVETFGRCLDAVVCDPAVHGVVVVPTPTALVDLSTVIPKVARHARDRHKPVVAVRVDQGASVRTVAAGEAGKVPSYADVTDAVVALAHAADYGEWRKRPRGHVPDLPGLDVAAARAVVADHLAAHPGGGWMDPVQAGRLLRAFGIPLVEDMVAADADEAVAAQRAFGRSVAIKAIVAGMVHKSEAGGVVLDLVNAEEVAEAVGRMRDRFGRSLRGVLVQPMAPPGVETLVGVVSDPTFGPLVVFGLGGVTADVLADRVSRLVPLTDVDAAEMVRSIRSAPLLQGYRGAAPRDTAAVEEVLLRVARLAELVPEVAELDLNPLRVYGRGCLAVDTRVLVEPRPYRDPFLRRLR